MTETAPRRSTYIDTTEIPVQEESPQPSEALRQTIAEARQAQVTDLTNKLEESEKLSKQRLEVIDNMSRELAELQETVAELKKTPRGVDTDVYEYRSDDGKESYIVVQIDTADETGNMRVYLNDGVIFEGDPEMAEKDEDIETDQENAEPAAPLETFADHLERFVRVADAGPAEVVRQLDGRNPMERAAFIASARRFAAEMRTQTSKLEKLAADMDIASGLFTEE